MKKARNTTPVENKYKKLIINIVYWILFFQIQVIFIASLVVLANFDSPFLFKYIYGLLVKLIIH